MYRSIVRLSCIWIVNGEERMRIEVNLVRWSMRSRWLWVILSREIRDISKNSSRMLKLRDWSSSNPCEPETHRDIGAPHSQRKYPNRHIFITIILILVILITIPMKSPPFSICLFYAERATVRESSHILFLLLLLCQITTVHLFIQLFRLSQLEYAQPTKAERNKLDKNLNQLMRIRIIISSLV